MKHYRLHEAVLEKLPQCKSVRVRVRCFVVKVRIRVRGGVNASASTDHRRRAGRAGVYDYQ